MPKRRKWKGWAEDRTGLPGYLKGNLRGIQGTGNEMIAVGRALKHGLVVFFKAWPDTNYDLVVDHKSVLFRVEVKGSQGPSLNLTRGQRRGKQISTLVASRERMLSRADCDIVIGVDAKNGDCYILPIDYVVTSLRKTASFHRLSRFRERWDLIYGKRLLPLKICKEGLLSRRRRELIGMCARIKTTRGFSAISKKELIQFFYESI